jgi:anti-sigma factor (TIGR02949 family)
MTPHDMRLQVDAYLDGELAPRDARELEQHLRECSKCSSVRDARAALSTAIRRELPAFTAPEELRSQIRDTLHSAARSPAAGRRIGPPLWRWGALAAGLMLVALGGWELGSRSAADSALTGQVLASHIRSLMPGHLTDVVSSDQHTVKPWFNGRLDFSPPVYDFAGKGYPLIGGRLDYLGGRQVAVLVYQRRRHLINVYLWPSTGGAAGERSPVTRQGYHLLHWNSASYVYWLVSDLGLTELTEFAGLLREGDSAAPQYRPGVTPE